MDASSAAPVDVKHSLHQSRFIHLLLSITLNSDILFLPSVKEAWLRVPTAVFGKRGINGLPDETWAELKAEISKTGIQHSDSNAGALICAHATVCAKYPRPSALAIPILLEHDLNVLEQYSDLGSAPVNLSKYWEEYDAGAQSTQTEMIPAPDSPLLAQVASTPNQTADQVVSQAAHCIVSFLYDFMPLSSTNPIPTALSQRTCLWRTKINEHFLGPSGGNDFFNPLRERAPSRKLVTSSIGPFSTHHIRSSSGFFSALIFRCITFACSAFLQRSHGNRFASLEEWNDAVVLAKASGLQDKDICNKRAYGSPSRHRAIGNAPAYWQAATTIWPAFLAEHNAQENGCIAWHIGLKFLRQESADRQLYFPGLGGLSSYLLAVDLVYAGVLTPPSIAELATAVCRLDSGARKGLVKLGLVTQDDSEHQFVAQFVQLYDSVTHLLSPHEIEETGWDIFVLEHALCKGGRLKIF